MAAKKGVILTEADLNALKTWMGKVDRFIKRQGQQPRADEIDKFQTNPEVYVARTPVAGIAALTEETGTGIEDTPGSAICNIYKLSEGSGRLVPLGYYIQVHNLSQVAFGGNRWVLVKQDALGVWWVEAPFPAPDVTETGTGTGLHGPVPPCGSAQFYFYRTFCEVDASSPTGATLNEYEYRVTVSYLPSGCLTQTIGAATFVRSIACCDLSCVSTSITGTTGTGTGTSAGGTVLTPCCSTGLPRTMYLSTGSLGNVTLVYDAASDKWLGVTDGSAVAPTAGAGRKVRFYCNTAGTQTPPCDGFILQYENPIGSGFYATCPCSLVDPELGGCVCGCPPSTVIYVTTFCGKVTT